MPDKQDVQPGTLALMILRTLEVLGPLHGYGVARRIEEVSKQKIQLNYGTAGIGTSQHMTAELFSRMTGIRMTGVAYKGGAPALVDRAVREDDQTRVGLAAPANRETTSSHGGARSPLRAQV